MTTTKMIRKIIKELESCGSPDRAKHSMRFFKTAKGQYAEGDLFYGATVPQMRNIVKKYKEIPLKDVIILLHNRYHECRLVALLCMVHRFELAKKDNDEKTMKGIFATYLNNTAYINNWDLVDVTAPRIIGAYLFSRKKERRILYKLARSECLWERRIAIISTLYFIVNKEFNDTINISEILIKDKHDLIHKACGWMLREVGKRGGLEREEDFLDKHHKTMPRTMLRYAVERFDADKKKKYMKR